MDTQTSNPYQPPVADSDTRSGQRFRMAAVLFVLVSALPTCLMLYWLGQHVVALWGSPTTSYRPILGAVGVAMSIATAVVAVPIALLLQRYGHKRDHYIVDLYLVFLGLPIVLGIAGPPLIAWATGSSFGS